MQNKQAGKTLMIIEDDLEILEVLEMIFQAEGYIVFSSTNGVETHDLSQIRPDLILLDIRLTPGGNEGEEICQRLKSQHSTSHIPIIFLSAELNIEYICHVCGADDYVSKPFDVDSLSNKVKVLSFSAA